MKYFFLILSQILISSSLQAQNNQPPLIRNEFSKLTSYDELSQYINNIDEISKLMTIEIIGESVKGRNIYALKFSSDEFGKDNSKIKVLIFAQQHGNEQSGKEGALLLVNKLNSPEYEYLFNKIDFVLIPQVNPDGSEVNKRRNANNMDLNRNHLILTEPEAQALHLLFDQYLFEVTMDVHEYSPFGEDWKNYGYRKNAEITLGTTTNLNVSEQIRKYSRSDYLPYFDSTLTQKGHSSFEYCPGGPPEVDYIRLSTFDINDGRQSFGIQNTLSFIQEGMNGSDDSIANIRRRAEAQIEGMICLLNFVYQNDEQIKKMVEEERSHIISEVSNKKVTIQSDHVKNGTVLQLPLLSYFTGNDTLVNVIDFRPEVKSLTEVKKPVGYLIPADSAGLVEWAERQQLKMEKFSSADKFAIEEYFVEKIDSIDFERDIIIDPDVTLHEFPGFIPDGSYYFIPTDQLKGNLVVIALEPKSMLGLVTYQNFRYLLKNNSNYPVLRVVEKQ